MDSVLRWRSGSKVSLSIDGPGFVLGWTGPIDPRFRTWCQIRLCNRNIDGTARRRSSLVMNPDLSIFVGTRCCGRQLGLLYLSLWIYRFMEIGIFRLDSKSVLYTGVRIRKFRKYGKNIIVSSNLYCLNFGLILNLSEYPRNIFKEY